MEGLRQRHTPWRGHWQTTSRVFIVSCSSQCNVHKSTLPVLPLSLGRGDGACEGLRWMGLTYRARNTRWPSPRVLAGRWVYEVRAARFPMCQVSRRVNSTEVGVL